MSLRTDRHVYLLCDRVAFQTTPLCVRCGRITGDHDLPMRIWARVARIGGVECWLWTGHQIWGGYGLAMWGGREQPVHRIIYEAVRGEITDGMQLDHLCRNRLCVNPDHLEEVTNRENCTRGAKSALKPDATSKFVGVSWDRPRKAWKAQAMIDGRQTFLGRFSTEEEAHAVYLNAITPAGVEAAGKQAAA